jgi:hypothetical protein
LERIDLEKWVGSGMEDGEWRIEDGVEVSSPEIGLQQKD